MVGGSFQNSVPKVEKLLIESIVKSVLEKYSILKKKKSHVVASRRKLHF